MIEIGLPVKQGMGMDVVECETESAGIPLHKMCQER